MSYYINTQSIISAYEELTSMHIDNASILHIFFILKACGFSRKSFAPVSDISEKGFEPAHAISSLFSHYENHPNKFDFVSPFAMSAWGSQSPSEPLGKWVGGRIKNNVIGGATTWRKIVEDDPNEGLAKFKYNYLDEVINLTLRDSKINIFALAIWAHRFSSFPKKLTLIELANIFKAEFNISNAEASQLFTYYKSNVFIDYDTRIHATCQIRQKIGLPKGQDNSWFRPDPNSLTLDAPRGIRDEKITNIIKSKREMENIIKELLDTNNQVVLAGPPGTSKSYYAKKIAADKYSPENVSSLQFHPKYSYHEFIGGYIVKGSEVSYSDGILFSIVERAKASTDEFLCIIDEINRANIGQVFGETIQCLDRNYSTNILRDRELTEFSLPKNLKIIATMNTADRSLGVMDYAIKRRFPTVYCPPEPDLISELCTQDLDQSLGDFLRIVNKKLIATLKNKELVIGHAFFLDDSVLVKDTYHWGLHNLEMMFNYKILPMIEDFTRGNQSQLAEVLGEELINQLEGANFRNALEKYILNES